MKLGAGIFAAVAAAVAVMAQAASAQDVPNLREARDLVFAERGDIEWLIYPHDSLSEVDIETLNQLNQIQAQPYYAAMAIAPAEGIAAATTSLAANYHDVDNARDAALSACESARSGGSACVIVMEIRPQGWQDGRPLQLSAEATAALRGEYRRLSRSSRAMATSASTGQWGVGEGREAAIAACGAADCTVVVER
jgi:hypothetical protein